MAAGPAPLPSTREEEALWASGLRFVAGVDEVGRGPLAGPVYAAAVILDPCTSPAWLGEVRDSKVLQATERERLSAIIRAEALAFGLGWATVPEIDGWGITLANRMAMTRALAALPTRPQYVLIDGPSRIKTPHPQKAIVDGDALCATISAASIVAKVARDAVMCELDGLYPQYGFAGHKGYATRDHLNRIARYGASVQHRRSWPRVQLAARGLDAAGEPMDLEARDAAAG
ncbi:MAG TPA: ribonuclease HII [Dehalococcoidia bacterium]|jgi:ribonuclease HII